MSFILWFCCGCATDPPERHQPTQVVAVVQAPSSSINQHPPPLPATGYAVAPHQSSPWAHAPYTTSYDPPQPPPWSQAHPVYAPPAPSPPTPVPEQAAVRPRRVPSSDDDHSPPPVTQKPPSYQSSTTPHDYPALPSFAQTSIPSCVPSTNAPSKTYQAPPSQMPPRSASGVHDSSRSTQMVPSRRVSSMQQAPDESLPAPVVPSQRPPQTAWPARQTSNKAYQTARPPKPPSVLSKSYDDTTPTPAWSEDLPPGALMDPTAPQLGVQNGDPRSTTALQPSLVQSNRLTFQNETTFYKTSSSS